MDVPSTLLGMLPCGAILFGFAALLAVMDVRSCRGYGLMILSALLLAGTILVVGTITVLAQVAPQPTTPHTYSVTILLVVYFVPAVYATALVLFTAAIEAGRAHNWLWLVGFFVAALVPVLLAVPPHPYVDMNIESWVQPVGFLGMLVAPEATALVYSIRHRVRPIAPVTVSQGASLS